MTVRPHIARCVWWLRQPERFVQRLKTLAQTQQVRSLAELEKLVSSQGVEIIDADLGPRIYGVATPNDGSPVIALKPGLGYRHRELTLAHEFAHVQFHLSGLAGAKSAGLPQVGTVEDEEADIYAFVCLMRPVPQQDETSRIVQYVLADPQNVRRWWGMYRYFLFYHLRLKIAACLESVFLHGPAQEVN